MYLWLLLSTIHTDIPTPEHDAYSIVTCSPEGGYASVPVVCDDYDACNVILNLDVKLMKLTAMIAMNVPMILVIEKWAVWIPLLTMMLVLMKVAITELEFGEQTLLVKIIMLVLTNHQNNFNSREVGYKNEDRLEAPQIINFLQNNLDFNFGKRIN